MLLVKPSCESSGRPDKCRRLLQRCGNQLFSAEVLLTPLVLPSNTLRTDEFLKRRPDFIRRIFLKIMNTLDPDFALVRPGATKFGGSPDQERAGISGNEELW